MTYTKFQDILLSNFDLWFVFHRLKKVQAMEDLRDIYQHFMLYYSHELPAMQEAFRKKEREEAKEKRRQERLARRAERGEGEEGADEEDVIEEEPPEEEEEEEHHENETLKQASRGGTYALCRKAGLGECEVIL